LHASVQSGASDEHGFFYLLEVSLYITQIYQSVL
jgi:hypothetical protein